MNRNDELSIDINAVAPVARQIIAGLDSALDLLISLNLQITDEQRLSVWCWHTALTTLARDIRNDTLTSCLTGSLRAARILNRSLLECAARIHYYTSLPQEAENDTADAHAMVRRVVKPVAQASGTDSNLKFMRQFYSSGTTRANQPQSDRMIAAMVNNLTSDEEQRNVGINFLEEEYSLATAYSHGSQAFFLHAFVMDDQGTKKLNRQSQSLKRGNAREKVHRKRYRGFAPLQHYGFGVRPAFPPRLLSRWLSPANSNTLP